MNLKKCAAAALAYVLVSGIFLTAAWFGSRTVTVIAQRSSVEGRHTIIIDPGHGGEDGGAVSCTESKKPTLDEVRELLLKADSVYQPGDDSVLKIVSYENYIDGIYYDEIEILIKETKRIFFANTSLAIFPS